MIKTDIKKKPSIEDLPIESLVPWGKNPRRHDIERIVKSIERFGFRAPLVVNHTEGQYIVEAGHGRLKAAQKLGLTSLPCEKLSRKCRMIEVDPHYCPVGSIYGSEGGED